MQRFALFLAMLTTIWVLQPVAAVAHSDTGMYSVHGIDVDVHADNATAAREKAVAQGARKGLEQLLRDLTTPDDAKSLPKVTEASAAPLVQDFEVESERVSPGRYIAKLGFRFRPDGVRALLGGVHFVGSRAPLVLIVPVYRAASGDMLWQPENSWRVAWKDAAARAALVPVVIPDGTPEDIQSFTTADLQNQDKLAALAERYKAASAVIVTASAVSAKGDPVGGMQVILSGGGGTDETFRSDGAATPGGALGNGVTATLARLDDEWKQHVLKGTNGAVQFKSAGTVADSGGGDVSAAPSGNAFAIRCALASPGDWAALRGRLSQLNGIGRIELRSLTRDQTIVVVTIAGDEDQLMQAFAAGGLTLGPAEAIPGSDGELASMIPSTGPGAGLLYPLNATGSR